MQHTDKIFLFSLSCQYLKHKHFCHDSWTITGQSVERNINSGKYARPLNYTFHLHFQISYLDKCVITNIFWTTHVYIRHGMLSCIQHGEMDRGTNLKEQHQTIDSFRVTTAGFLWGPTHTGIRKVSFTAIFVCIFLTVIPAVFGCTVCHYNNNRCRVPLFCCRNFGQPMRSCLLRKWNAFMFTNTHLHCRN